MGTQTPRHRLTDILDQLPKGAQKRIAERCHCAPSTVSNVLNGKQTQNSNVAINIIRVAELMCNITF